MRFPIWRSVVLNGIDGILMYLTQRSIVEELKLKQFKNMGDKDKVNEPVYARDYFMKSIYLTNIAIKYRNIVKGICKRTAA